MIRHTVYILLLIAALTGAVEAHAQYFRFGANKVQYEQLNWSYLQSEHFDIFYYEPGGQTLARFAIEIAESFYPELIELFDYEPAQRIAILVYQDHHTFAVTNIADLPLHAEGIGGVTELYKNRVALPFTGDLRNFRNVLRHELVHAVANDFFYGGSFQRLIRSGIQLRLPLWFSEGLAEYAAFGWDTNSDMYLREGVTSNHLPEIHELRGYMAYRGGQGVFDYIAAEFGREAITEILHVIRQSGSLEYALEEVLGLDLEVLSDRWHETLRETHSPEIATRTPLDRIAHPLPRPGRSGGYVTGATLSPDGTLVAYLYNEGALFDVYVAPTSETGSPTRLISGQTSTDFESFRVLTSGMAWSPAGTQLAIAVKAGPTEAITVVDIETRRTRHIRLDDIDTILTLSWSPDGERMAFSGLRFGQSDLYVLNLADESLHRLTDDSFADLSPAWSPDGRELVFYSDRHTGLDTSMHRIAASPYALYRITPGDDQEIEQLTHPTEADHTHPLWIDGHILFISDENGIPNLYALDVATRQARPLTDLIVGIQQVDINTGGTIAVLTSLDEGQPCIFFLENPLELEQPDEQLQPNIWTIRRSRTIPDILPPALQATSVEIRQRNPFLREALTGTYQTPPSPEIHPDTLTIEDHRYRLRFSPDLLYGNLGYDAIFGIQSFTQITFSDLLGNHQFRASSNLVVDLRNSDYLLSYHYLQQRTDYILTGFHMARQLTDFERQAFFRYRNYGLIGNASYPLDKFRRIEGELSIQAVTLTNLMTPTQPSRRRVFTLPAVTYTVDRSVPGFLSPSAGRRFALRLSGSPGPDVTFVSALADGRQYYSIGLVSVALRAAAGASTGTDRQRFYTSGVQNWLNPSFQGLPIRDEHDFVFGTPIMPLRGFDFDAASGNTFILTNLETRIPLLDEFPFIRLPIYYIQTITFVDAAAIGEDFRFNLTLRDDQGFSRFDDLYVGSGIGLRAIVLGFPFRVDWAWLFDGRSFGSARYYISLGLDL